MEEKNVYENYWKYIERNKKHVRKEKRQKGKKEKEINKINL